MASEISLSVSLRASKPSTTRIMDFSPGSLTFDMSGNNADQRIVTVSTTYGAVSFSSDIGTEGYAYFRNLDSTNYLELGVEVSSAFYPLVKLKAGRVAVFPLAIQGLFAKANTASCHLQFGVLED